MKTRLLVTLLAGFPLFLGLATARTWKEAGSDRTLEGDFKRVEGENVVIIKPNGTALKVALSRLSEEDQAFVKEQQSADKEADAPKDVYKWETDFELAKKRAASEKKAMLLDFTGSDWCGWCIKLKKEVFDESAFQKYAAENLILVELDFPRSKELSKKLKEQNDELAKEYKIQGYPTIILLNSKGREVARTGYREGGPEKYVEHLEELLK